MIIVTNVGMKSATDTPFFIYLKKFREHFFLLMCGDNKQQEDIFKLRKSSYGAAICEDKDISDSSVDLKRRASLRRITRRSLDIRAYFDIRMTPQKHEFIWINRAHKEIEIGVYVRGVTK